VSTSTCEPVAFRVERDLGGLAHRVGSVDAAQQRRLGRPADRVGRVGHRRRRRRSADTSTSPEVAASGSGGSGVVLRGHSSSSSRTTRATEVRWKRITMSRRR
jgi:hypothetical protein